MLIRKTLPGWQESEDFLYPTTYFTGNMAIEVTNNGYLITSNAFEKQCFVPVENVNPNTFGFYVEPHGNSGLSPTYSNAVGYAKFQDIQVIEK